MNTDSSDEPWVLLRPESYTYLAVPLAQFPELMRSVKVMTKEGYGSGPYELGSTSTINMTLLPGDAMIAAQVRSRMLGDKPDGVS